MAAELRSHGGAGRLDEARIQHLCRHRPDRVIEMVGAAQRRGEKDWASRATLALLSCPKVEQALAHAVRSQTFRSTSHDLDELIDGARLAVVEQVTREMPEVESLAQLRSWVATIARRHVISVTRLKREQVRRQGASLDAGPEESEAFISVANRESLSPEERCAGNWAVLHDELRSAGELQRTVVMSHLVSGRPAAETVELVAQRLGEQISEAAVARMSDAFSARCRAACA